MPAVEVLWALFQEQLRRQKEKAIPRCHLSRNQQHVPKLVSPSLGHEWLCVVREVLRDLPSEMRSRAVQGGEENKFALYIGWRHGGEERGMEGWMAGGMDRWLSGGQDGGLEKCMEGKKAEVDGGKSR